MKNITYTRIMQFITTLSILVLGTSFYLQYIKGFEPCPLCLMQRLCIITILILSIVGLCLHKSTRHKQLVIALFCFGLAGLYFAGRQMQLFSLTADHIPACLPGLAVLIHYFPWHELVRALFWGSGDCTEITWRFLGVSLPTWSAFYFSFMLIANGLLYYKLHQRPAHKK